MKLVILIALLWSTKINATVALSSSSSLTDQLSKAKKTKVQARCSLDEKERIQNADLKNDLEQQLVKLKILKQNTLARDQGRNQSEHRALMQDFADAEKKIMESIRQVEVCIFQFDINKTIKNLKLNTENQNMLRKLENIATCFSPIQKLDESTLGPIKDFFRNIFNHFWNKDQLTDEDCAVLEHTYSVWASYYDQENSKNNEQSSEKIPLYNVNDHNASFYAWAKEQHKGTIPPTGLTILHADTHTDMSHVHSHTYGMWYSSVFDLRDINNLLMIQDEAQLKQKLIEGIERKQQITGFNKQTLIDNINMQDLNDLRAQLETGLHANVNHIAQPLVGALATGVSNGNYIMCMPPWSDELPRSQCSDPNSNSTNCQRQGWPYILDLNISQLQLYRDCENPKYIEMSNKVGGIVGSNPQPCYPYFLRNQKQSKYKQNANFQVADCNNETRQLAYEGESTNDSIYQIKERNTPLPPLIHFFSENEKKNGFLLDLDLDVFVSEGIKDRNELNSDAEPISHGRRGSFDIKDGTKKSNEELHKLSEAKKTDTRKRDDYENGFIGHNGILPHSGHESFSELDPKVQVTSMEFELIQKRMDLFFDQLKKAKEEGYLPKVITISDSTALERMHRAQMLNDQTFRGTAFTPNCLAFLLNYMAKSKLNDLYGVDFKYQPPIK